MSDEQQPETVTFVATGAGSLVFAGAARAGIKISKDDHRPWVEKWRLVLHHLARLRRYYEEDVPDTGNLDVEAWATSFFVERDHLKDWLCADIPTLGGLTKPEITDYAEETSVPLMQCYAICNTHKHHTRMKPSKQMTARIGTVESLPSTATGG